MPYTFTSYPRQRATFAFDALASLRVTPATMTFTFLTRDGLTETLIRVPVEQSTSRDRAIARRLGVSPRVVTCLSRVRSAALRAMRRTWPAVARILAMDHYVCNWYKRASAIIDETGPDAETVKNFIVLEATVLLMDGFLRWPNPPRSLSPARN